MADESKDEKDNDLEAGDAPSGAGGKGIMMVMVGLIVVVETAMVLFMVPSAEQVSAIAEANLIKSIEETEQNAEELVDDENERQEFPLGMFGEVFSPYDTEKTYMIEIDLYGLVRKKDLDKMKEEFEKKGGRIRHQIRQKIRACSIVELNENNHAVLQRRILAGCNHLLEEDLLLQIGIKSYRPIEQ
ncbi:MAG: dihydrolipoamide acetyltransferase [Planctomycetota bacterium]